MTSPDSKLTSSPTLTTSRDLLSIGGRAFPVDQVGNLIIATLTTLPTTVSTQVASQNEGLDSGPVVEKTPNKKFEFSAWEIVVLIWVLIFTYVVLNICCLCLLGVCVNKDEEDDEEAAAKKAKIAEDEEEVMTLRAKAIQPVFKPASRASLSERGRLYKIEEDDDDVLAVESLDDEVGGRGHDNHGFEVESVAPNSLPVIPEEVDRGQTTLAVVEVHSSEPPERSPVPRVKVRRESIVSLKSNFEIRTNHALGETAVMRLPSVENVGGEVISKF